MASSNVKSPLYKHPLWLTLEHVEAPVHCVEEDKREWEDQPRVLVDNVDIFNGGDGAFDSSRALLQRGEDSLPVRSSGGVDAGARLEGVVPVDPEGGWKLNVL